MNKPGGYFNLEVTYSRAVERLAAREPAEAARCAGVAYDAAGHRYLLPFLGQNYSISLPGGAVTDGHGSRVSLYLSIILLHYLATADGSPLTGQWVSFRHLPGGDIYMIPFQRRAVEPFLKAFGARPDHFTRAAEALGGHSGPTGGLSRILPVLPRVPLNFILWPGDEEFPASANILFDAAAASYLPTEDYAHLPALVTGALKAQEVPGT